MEEIGPCSLKTIAAGTKIVRNCKKRNKIYPITASGTEREATINIAKPPATTPIIRE